MCRPLQLGIQLCSSACVELCCGFQVELTRKIWMPCEPSEPHTFFSPSYAAALCYASSSTPFLSAFLPTSQLPRIALNPTFLPAFLPTSQLPPRCAESDRTLEALNSLEFNQPFCTYLNPPIIFCMETLRIS